MGLWLKGNPLVVPPATVWKVSQTAPIWAHLRALELEKIEHLQPLKIVMLGVTSAHLLPSYSSQPLSIRTRILSSIIPMCENNFDLRYINVKFLFKPETQPPHTRFCYFQLCLLCSYATAIDGPNGCGEKAGGQNPHLTIGIIGVGNCLTREFLKKHQHFI